MKKHRLLRKYGVKSSDITVMAVTKREAIFKFMNEGLGVTWPMIYEIESPGAPPPRRGRSKTKK